MNDGKEFEFEVRQLLRLMGLDAEVTGFSQDGGVDLIAVNPSPLTGGKCIVQCKAWSAPVGEPVLRDLFGTMHAEGANKGILITTSTFTAAARRFAQGKTLELIDGAQYRELCEQYGLAAHGSVLQTVIDELLQPNCFNVRITSVDCSDPKKHKSLQYYVFRVGRLSIGSSLTFFDPPEVCSLELPYDRITEIEIGPSKTKRLEELVLNFTMDAGYGVATYCFRFEGRGKLLMDLWKTASAKKSADFSRAAKNSPASSGCLVMLLLPLALTAVLKLFLR